VEIREIRGMHQTLMKRQLRSFGLTVGGVFAGIGLWPYAFGDGVPRIWALVPAALLAAPALLFPGILQPAFRAWMFIGRILGWINTRIILGALFYTLFSAFGCLLRLLGKDPMHRTLDPGIETYRTARQLRAPDHMTHQF
jgi:hypothetical protein